MVAFSLSESNAKPHLTVRLVLELMAAEPAAAQRPTNSPSAGNSYSRGLNGSESAKDLRALVKAASYPASAAAAGTPTPSIMASSFDFSDDDSVQSGATWEDQDNEEEDCLDSCEDRGRLGATAGARALSGDDELLAVASEQNFTAGAPGGARATSALDEFGHPSLTGAVAALHGYVASGADIVFLEKAYDLARGVAGAKHELCVAFNACRMALAVGYVYTLKSGTLESAQQFALHNSLPKLALSLEPYWSRIDREWGSLAEELGWEECMLSLLEVTSSVFILVEEKDVISALDKEVGAGVAEAIGLYCVLNPDVMSQYPELGRACTRRHISSLDGVKQRHIVEAFKNRVQESNAGFQQQRVFADSE